MSSEKQWMIYGANGYTGELIARQAVEQGLRPVLAGRNEETISELARELKLDYRVFGLGESGAVARHLDDMELVLHCAGPFSATSAPMIEACLLAKAHYLDITGEISVFEHAQAQHVRAKQAGIVVCPGVGFDVIPTDCVAAKLKQAMPDATHLALGFDSRSGFSPGTAKTSVEGMAQGGKIRHAGQIQTVPLGYKVRLIDFGAGNKQAVTIPWGDVSTAFYTTKIPNIEVYIPAPPKLIAGMKRANLIKPLLGLSWVQKLIKSRIEKNVKGPDAAQREKMPTHVWGEVSNAAGMSKTARVKTANGYTVTLHGSLAVADKLLSDPPATGGSYTPSQLMGADFVSTLPGSDAIKVT